MDWHDLAPPITLYGRLLPKIGQQQHTMVIAVVQYHLGERVASILVAKWAWGYRQVLCNTGIQNQASIPFFVHDLISFHGKLTE